MQLKVSASTSATSDKVASVQVKIRDAPPGKAPSPASARPPAGHINAKLPQLSVSPRPATPVDISDKCALLCSPDEAAVGDDGGLRKRKKQKKKHKKDSERWHFEKLREDSSSRSDSSSKKNKKHKKNRQEKKRKRSSSVSSDSDSCGKRKDKKKHQKHKYSRGHSHSSSSDEDRHKHKKKTSESDDLDGYEWVEKTIETTNVRDNNSRGEHIYFCFLH